VLAERAERALQELDVRGGLGPCGCWLVPTAGHRRIRRLTHLPQPPQLGADPLLELGLDPPLHQLLLLRRTAKGPRSWGAAGWARVLAPRVHKPLGTRTGSLDGVDARSLRAG
jgi:hypothetical protein